MTRKMSSPWSRSKARRKIRMHLVLKLADTGQTIQLSKDKPFRRVDGYTADLKYDPENGQLVGATDRQSSQICRR